MISHLCSYLEIVTLGCEILNYPWRIDLCQNVECIMFNYFETLKDKIVSDIFSKYFRQSKITSFLV